MRRSVRLFEIIQILRAADRPVTAAALAERLEVSRRTIYRDVVALQGSGAPVAGEAGLGYVMRRGYDLPPLNFDVEEVEALHVGLAMLARTGDGALQRAAQRVCEKIDACREGADWIHVAPWGAPLDDPANGCVRIAHLRAAVREARKLRLTYRDEREAETVRTVRPVALIYHIGCTLLVGWCELRGAFRHFRTDRIWGCEALAERFEAQSRALRDLWRESRMAEVGEAAGAEA